MPQLQHSCHSCSTRTDATPTHRFSALPPGFVHEIPQHLKRPPPNEPPKDPLTGLPVLDFANYCCGAHGLSILIVGTCQLRLLQNRKGSCLAAETGLIMQITTIGDKTYQVLMDGGPEHLTIERNVKAMAVDLKDLDAIVLSHWHSDRASRPPFTLPAVTRHICIVGSVLC